MDNLSAYGKATIARGSKSFAKAAMLFDSETRQSVTLLYAWCRYCDDVIDGQTLGHGLQQLSAAEKQARLAFLQQETARICNGQGSDLPAFAALRQVVRKHGIERRHLFDLLAGFALDAEEARFRSLDDTLHYCYHVAGVVGVMMARIMGADERDVLLRAADLGIAFQLTNIARDVRDDMRIGRCYLPEEWLDRMRIPKEEIASPHHQSGLHTLACELVDLAEHYYASARIGMARLPWRSAWAIASALLIYRHIGLQVKSAGNHAWQQRAHASGSQKIWYLCQGLCVAVDAVGRKRDCVEDRAGLWTKAGF
jgi:phytoene synthase